MDKEQQKQVHDELFRNWWPPVPIDVYCYDPVDVELGDRLHRIEVWSDGIYRTKLHWPDNLLA